MRLSHSHLSVICFVKERKRIIKHFISLSIKTFLKTSKNQTNCDILTCSFSHRRSSEEPNYTLPLKNRQPQNRKKFHKTKQQPEIQRLLFQNILEPNSINIKGRLKSISDDLMLFNLASYFTNLSHSENIYPPEYRIASLTYIDSPQNCLFTLYPC